MPTTFRERRRVVAPFDNGGYEERKSDSFRFSLSHPQLLRDGWMNDYVTRDESRYPVEFSLDHEEEFFHPLTFNGDWPEANNRSVNYQPRNQYFTDPGRLKQFRQTIDWSYYVTKLISGLNPNRPIVDIPLFIFELKDMPRMIRDLGRVKRGDIKASDVPGGYLAYQFGWAPLVSDLKKFLNVADAIDKRIEEIKRLSEGKSVRRKLDSVYRQVGQSSVSSPTVKGVVPHYQQDEVWGVARTKVDASIALGYSPFERFKAFYGLGPDSAHTLWNALPWTWFIDYFSNVGSVLQARRGGLTWELEHCHIMWRSTMYSRAELKTAGKIAGVSLTGGYSQVVSQQRRYFPSPIPSFATEPFLTHKQVGILGALFTAQALRRIRR